MIKKAREYPLRLKMEEALLRLLPFHHQKRKDIQERLRKGKAGYRGEQEMDYHLKFLPEKDFLIFQDLRLPYLDQFIQMDTLILSPWFLLIIESKNIYGHLFFDPISKQLIRTFENVKEGFSDPLTQARRQQMMLQKWLETHIQKPCPIHFLVAIGYPRTVVETRPGNEHIFRQILHAEHIPEKILDLVKESPKRSISSYQMKKVSEALLLNHEPLVPDLLGAYQIHPSEFLKGIPCPGCKKRPMQRIHANWLCQHCSAKERKAHIQVIQDYLLFYPSITNAQCREWLNLESEDTARRLLLSMNLVQTGKNQR